MFCTCYIVSVRFLFCLHSGDIFTLGMLTCGCWHKSKGVFEGSSLVLTVRSLDKGYSADTVCVCMCVCVCDSYKGTEIELSLAVKCLPTANITKSRREESRGQAEVGREEMKRIRADEDKKPTKIEKTENLPPFLIRPSLFHSSPLWRFW